MFRYHPLLHDQPVVRAPSAQPNMAVIQSLSNPPTTVHRTAPSGPSSPPTPKAGIRSIFGRAARPAHITRTTTSPAVVQSEPVQSVEEPHEGNIVMYSIFRNSMDQQPPPADAPLQHSSTIAAKRTSRAAARVAAPKKASDRFSAMGRWTPPPLFEAYPQAVKHAYLETPVAPAEELIRRHHYERYTRLRQEMVPEGKTGASQIKVVTPEESPAPAKADCHNKIFVLVNGGYLLQYAGKGSYDRLPEKVLPLGKNSVVLASDAIPGKPWVLQVSQRSHGAETGAMDNATSVFMRLSLRGSTARKAVGSMLLVLYSAEEMETWMATIGTQIESMGGRPLSVDGREHEKAGVPILDLPRHPHQTGLGVRTLETPESSRSTPLRLDQVTYPADLHLHDTADPLSPFRPSFEAPSVSPTVASDDQMQLDSLRDEFRLSHSSSSASSNPPSSGERSLVSTPDKEEFHSPPVVGRPVLPIRHTSPRLPSTINTQETTKTRTPRTPKQSSEYDSLGGSSPLISEGVSPRTRIPRVPLQPIDEPHPGRRMSIGTSWPVSPNTSPQQPSHQLWGQAEWQPSRSLSGRSSHRRSASLADIDSADPTAAISRSILQLLSSSISEDELFLSSASILSTSPPLSSPRRSPSTRRRSRRPSNRSARGGSISSAIARPPLPPLHTSTSPSKDQYTIPPSYYPEPLRINKRASLYVAVSSPPPLPPPRCPLPAIPAEPTLQRNPSTSDARVSELRKQSWKVTRAYHPLRVDVL